MTKHLSSELQEALSLQILPHFSEKLPVVSALLHRAVRLRESRTGEALQKLITETADAVVAALLQDKDQFLEWRKLFGQSIYNCYQRGKGEHAEELRRFVGLTQAEQYDAESELIMHTLEKVFQTLPGQQAHSN